MGFGMGAAVGAQLAAPDKQVFLITGDGSFHMDLTELSTAVRYGAAVKVIVMDNESLGMVRQWQSLHYGARFAKQMKRAARILPPSPAPSAHRGCNFRHMCGV